MEPVSISNIRTYTGIATACMATVSDFGVTIILHNYLEWIIFVHRSLKIDSSFLHAFNSCNFYSRAAIISLSHTSGEATSQESLLESGIRSNKDSMTFHICPTSTL